MRSWLNRKHAIMKFTLCSAIVVVLFCVVSANHTIPLKTKKRILEEYINTEYVGTIGLGKQSFEVVFDTSSYNVIVADETCISGGCQCAGIVKYQVTQSTRLGPSDEIVNVTILDTAHAIGKEAHDSLTISTLNATDQGFVLATDISPEICFLEADGVAGMGRPKSGRAAFNLSTVLETFISLGEIEGVFSIYHARRPDGEHFGEIIFGGVFDRYYKGNLTYVPLIDSTTWNFKLDSLKVGNEEVVVNTSGFIDSSKSVIVGPTAEINNINEKLGCTEGLQGSLNICKFNCSEIGSLPDVTLVIGGRNFNISAEYHVQQQGSLCYSGFSPSDLATAFHIGDFFIDHYISVFDSTNNRMGFAVSTGSL